MPKPKLNRARENRITDEIVVDAYNEEERAMGWYCYLEEIVKKVGPIPKRVTQAKR